MLRLGLSPTTGKESKDQSCCHTTLHNWTTGGAIVEWSPITRMKNLNGKNKHNHINKLVNHAHQYIIATGQVCLSQFDIIPSFFQFLNDLKQRISTHEIEEMYNEYRPRSNEEAEIETEKAIKAGKHFVLLNRRGNNDSYLEWLQENQGQFN